MRRALLLLATTLALAGVPPVAAPHDAAAASVTERIVSIARGELRRSVREVPEGSNRGARIRMYGQSTVPRFYPAPWCAYFVSWLARRAGRPLGPAGRGFGYVPYIRAWAKRTGKWRTQPRSGDLIMFPQHVGMVERVLRNGTLTTIEGNSSNRVARRWRRWRDASGYVRFAPGGTVEKPGSKPVTRPPARPTGRPVARISVYPSRTVAVAQEVGFSANDSSGDLVRYRWDLDGDGQFDDAKGDNAARSYLTAGDVKVGLRVTDRRGRTSIARATVQVRQNAAPVADLDLPSSARVGTRVVAHAEDSKDPDGEIARFEWDMDGDGVWVEGGDHHEMTYSRPGVHTVGLRVVDDQGAVTEAIRTIEITHKPPVARASVPEDTGLGRDATFDGTRSYDPDGDVAAWLWDVGGDGTVDAEGARPTWRFTRPGALKVRLTVRDQWGAEASTERTVNVVNTASAPVITPPAAPVAGDEIVFDAGASSDPDSRITRHEWDFDDDGHWDVEGVRARWRYTGSGDRRVRLRVTDEWGAQRTTTKTVRLWLRPVASITLVTSSPAAGSRVTFTGQGSTDGDGSIERLEWDFTSDGVVDAVTTRWWHSAHVTYAQAGSHPVSLTVVDDDGLRTTTQRIVVVR